MVGTVSAGGSQRDEDWVSIEVADPPDFAPLYLRYRDAMYKIAASVLRPAGLVSQAGDAVNDAVVSILASPPSGIRNWEAFLVLAVKRKALDRIGSAAARHAGPEFLESVHDKGDGTDIAEDVAVDLDRKQRAAVAASCLPVLDDRHRKVVWDIAALERPRSDVAMELGVTPARVSQMMKRALGLLHEEMTRREGENDAQ